MGRTQLEDKRRAILSAAEKVFDARGYTATTVQEIAAAAGVSKGSIYNYFRSKEDLFGQIFSDVVCGELGEFGKLVDQSLSATEKLKGVLDLWYARVERYSRIGRLVLELWTLAAREERPEGGLGSTLRRLHDDSCRLVASILSQGAASGEFGRQFDTPLGASLLVALLDGVLIDAILQRGPRLDAEFLSGLKRAVLAAVGAPLEAA